MLTLNVSYLRAALLSASTEETRYYLRGVQILRRGDHLRITATDGHRLFCAMQKADAAGPDFDIILPSEGLKKALTGLYRTVEFLSLDLELQSTVTLNQVKRAVLNDVGMQPIDGTFPSIERVVPSEISGELTQFNPSIWPILANRPKFWALAPLACISDIMVNRPP
jgi:DNA polymerase III sliding clamp (beta) subunit (PCNA family)